MYRQINKSSALTISSLFFGAVGVGFALITEFHYAIISLIFATIGLMYNDRFLQMVQGSGQDSRVLGVELIRLTQAVVYGMLPTALLITISAGSVLSVIVGALYLLAVAIRISYLSIPEHERIRPKEAHTHGVPLKYVTLVFPLVTLLAYLIPLTIFSYILIVIMFLLAAGFVVDYSLPKILDEWQMFVIAYLLIMIILYIIFGSFWSAA